jgi:hypothetical protein
MMRAERVTLGPLSLQHAIANISRCDPGVVYSEDGASAGEGAPGLVTSAAVASSS